MVVEPEADESGVTVQVDYANDTLNSTSTTGSGFNSIHRQWVESQAPSTTTPTTTFWVNISRVSG